MNNFNKNKKKIEAAIVKAMNDVCDILKQEYVGFAWVTHFVDYQKIEQSLKLVFVFDTTESINQAKEKALFETIFELTESRLKRESISIKRIDRAVFFDTEENGADFNNTNWCRKYS